MRIGRREAETDRCSRLLRPREPLIEERNQPVDVDVDRSEGVTIRFADGYVTRLGLTELRRGCPCATCRTQRDRGEASWPRPDSPEGLRIIDAQLHGAYAVQFTWNDGHRTGLYSFDLLRDWEPEPPH